MRRAVIEAAIAAVVAFVTSLIVFGPLLGDLDVGWAGGDMLSTYVNTHAWNGFGYGVSTHFGFPLGMNLNYFPGIDITENTFAMVVDNLTGSTFLGINLLVVLSFPLVAALAYLVIRMTGLRGPLAIALAVAFTFIPFHWGRALGHTYLSTLYSAVLGLALVMLVASGTWERRRSWRLWLIVSVMAVGIAWTGVYYVAFTLILGLFALVWRIAQRTGIKALVLDAVPFAGVAVLAAIGFVPSLLALKGDEPLQSLGERMASESVTYAGNLAMAILPIPQSVVPRMGYYNEAVLRAFADAPYSESNVITNFGTWITALALVVFAIALVTRGRQASATPKQTKTAQQPSTRVGLGLIAYFAVVTVLFFVPWGLNFLFAEFVTPQIRGWNRLLPILLLLFILGAAAGLQRTRIARQWSIAVPVAIVALALVAVDSVYPFKTAYAGSVADAGATTRAARDYAAKVNSAIPEDCGVLQLPYMAYPEHGLERSINDYDHFWSSITNDAKSWSYGSVKYTDASTWAAQLPQSPTDEQIEYLRAAGFCAIHLDAKGYISEVLQPLEADFATRFGSPVASGFDGRWQLYDIRRSPSADAASTDAFLHQPFISTDIAAITVRDSVGHDAWWWTMTPSGTFGLLPTDAAHPVTSVSGEIQAPACGAIPVTLTLVNGEQSTSTSTTLAANPEQPTPFELTFDKPTAGGSELIVDVPGQGCPTPPTNTSLFAQIRNLQVR